MNDKFRWEIKHALFSTFGKVDRERINFQVHSCSARGKRHNIQFISNSKSSLKLNIYENLLVTRTLMFGEHFRELA